MYIIIYKFNKQYSYLFSKVQLNIKAIDKYYFCFTKIPENLLVDLSFTNKQCLRLHALF